MPRFDSIVGLPLERDSARKKRSGPSRCLWFGLDGLPACWSASADRTAAPRPRTGRHGLLAVEGSRGDAELHDGQVLTSLYVVADQLESASGSSRQAPWASPRERVIGSSLAAPTLSCRDATERSLARRQATQPLCARHTRGISAALSERRHHQRDGLLEPFLHQRARQPQHAVAHATEVTVPPRIRPGTPRVHFTVDLDHELRLRRAEVGDVPTQRDLPPEPHAELLSAERLPEQRLGGGGRRPEGGGPSDDDSVRCAHDDLPSPASWPGFGVPWRRGRDALARSSRRRRACSPIDLATRHRARRATCASQPEAGQGVGRRADGTRLALHSATAPWRTATSRSATIVSVSTLGITTAVPRVKAGSAHEHSNSRRRQPTSQRSQRSTYPELPHSPAGAIAPRTNRGELVRRAGATPRAPACGGIIYDRIGNLLELFHSAGGGANTWTRTYSYTTGTNQLASNTIPGGSATYTHDAHGSITSMPHLASITYGPFDQMANADLGGGGDAYYQYDASGQRVRKLIDTGANLIKERIYLGAYEIYREHISGDIDLERQSLHVMDGTRRVAVLETLTIEDGNPVTTPVTHQRFQLGNHLDSALLEVDEAGMVVSYEELLPYGASAYRSARSDVDVSPRRYRYTGKERDDETGLYYYGARYYACWLGRWTSADPLGIGADGPGLYNYTRGSPVVLVDPTGGEPMPPPAAGVSPPPPPPPPGKPPSFGQRVSAATRSIARGLRQASSASAGGSPPANGQRDRLERWREQRARERAQRCCRRGWPQGQLPGEGSDRPSAPGASKRHAAWRRSRARHRSHLLVDAHHRDRDGLRHGRFRRRVAEAVRKALGQPRRARPDGRAVRQGE
jgi:RHS repeat-associated protein